MGVSRETSETATGDGPVYSAEIGGRSLRYRLCRAWPDTALVLRDVMLESERLWIRDLGEDVYTELVDTAEGADFFTARVRLESVPPERKLVALWLPFPPGFADRLRPQLVDFIEAPTEIPKAVLR